MNSQLKQNSLFLFPRPNAILPTPSIPRLPPTLPLHSSIDDTTNGSTIFPPLDSFEPLDSLQSLSSLPQLNEVDTLTTLDTIETLPLLHSIEQLEALNEFSPKFATMNTLKSTSVAFSSPIKTPSFVPKGTIKPVSNGKVLAPELLDVIFDEVHKVPFSLASALNVAQEDHSHPVEVIGHRGSLYTALENTSRSFVHAAQAGADGVELDVFLLKCGTLVVFHGSGGDEEPGLLHSYCGVEGSILDYTAKEARSLLTFNKHFDEFGCGPSQITHPEDDTTTTTSRIPHYCYVHTLEEVLTTLENHPEVPSNFSIKIELKGPNTAIPTVQLVNKLNMQHRCHYSSFDHSRIAQVRQLDPTAITGALFADDLPEDFVQKCLDVGATEVHFKYDTCTKERVTEAHQAGLSTMAWFRGPVGMVEDITEKYHDVGNEDGTMYETVLKSGVRSMCVNRPGIMVEVAERMGRRMKWWTSQERDAEEKKIEDALPL